MGFYCGDEVYGVTVYCYEKNMYAKTIYEFIVENVLDNLRATFSLKEILDAKYNIDLLSEVSTTYGPGLSKMFISVDPEDLHKLWE